MNVRREMTRFKVLPAALPFWNHSLNILMMSSEHRKSVKIFPIYHFRWRHHAKNTELSSFVDALIIAQKTLIMAFWAFSEDFFLAKIESPINIFCVQFLGHPAGLTILRCQLIGRMKVEESLEFWWRQTNLWFRLITCSTLFLMIILKTFSQERRQGRWWFPDTCDIR